ncbi:MAG: DUF47 family protein [Clostridia bacterium]|nr:DUF47 family protein [Clostridia bacterium]MDE6472114.1 DUF47 family protein [Clostridia bacterium]
MKIFRKKVNFFQLLTSQCEIMRRGLDALHKYCLSVGEPEHESYGDMVITIEDEGDMARRNLVNELNATFITPMERNDIFDLSGQLDEVLDYAKNSIDEMRFFKIEPNEDMTKMVAILCDIAEHIEKAVANMEKHKNVAKEEAFNVKSLENEVGARYYKALASLFEGDDFKSIFKYREVYRHLNTTADKAEMAMDILLDILNSL